MIGNLPVAYRMALAVPPSLAGRWPVMAIVRVADGISVGPGHVGCGGDHITPPYWCGDYHNHMPFEGALFVRDVAPVQLALPASSSAPGCLPPFQ